MNGDHKVRLPLSNDAPPARPAPSARERVIQRLKRLAPVAVLAAAPVLNTACDPAPEPYCSEGDPVDWVANVTAEAVWIDDGTGALKIQVTLKSTDQFAYLPSSYTATGATIESTTPSETGDVLILVPNAAVTEAKIAGELSCEGYPGPFEVTLTWTGMPAAGDAVTAKVAAAP